MMVFAYISEALFYVFILLVAFGGLVAVRAGLLMHAVLGLAVSLLGVAGLYFYLGSIFLTLMQVLIYVGAICIVLVFGIMVGYTPTEVAEKNIKGAKKLILAACAGCSAFFLLAFVVISTDWAPATDRVKDFTLGRVGEQLMYQYCLVFELISVVLLVAIVGSIILARSERKGDQEKSYYLGTHNPDTYNAGGDGR
ncbi:MAG: NADH-quinone oxidoreductase subunit J [Deltaproteobacteria bacterium]|nr:MAG: NADH-quinone oxidoreductase subunit J [Deltaproteobacteria bacterium]